MTTTALKITTLPTAAPSAPARLPRLNRRPLAMRLEMAAILSLLGSSTAYVLYTLLHLG